MAASLARGPSGQGVAGVANDLAVAFDVKEYSSFGSIIDLTTDTYSSAMPRVPRGIMVTDVGAGTKLLVVAMANGQPYGPAPVTRTLTMTNLQGVFMPMACRAIMTTTTVARLIVFW